MSKEEGNYDEASNEEGIKSMIFEKDWDPYLGDVLLKIVSRIVCLFLDDSFFDVETSSGTDERVDSSLEKV